MVIANRQDQLCTRRAMPKRSLRQRCEFLESQAGFRKSPVLTLFRLASWRARCLLSKPVILSLRRWNVKMTLPSQWRGFAKFVFAFRENYEPELGYLTKILNPGKVFVDVGANMGIYTLVASKIVGSTGRVIAFEPSVQSFSVLLQNIALNRSSNVVPFRVAASEKEGIAWLHHALDPSGNSLGKQANWGKDGENVDTETLDNVLERASVNHVDLIKVDVEGAEELVLRGTLDTLRTHRPVVIFEFNPGCAAGLGHCPFGAAKLLESVGYELFVLGDYAKAASNASHPTYFNVIAIPQPPESRPPSSISFEAGQYGLQPPLNCQRFGDVSGSRP